MQWSSVATVTVTGLCPGVFLQPVLCQQQESLTTVLLALKVEDAWYLPSSSNSLFLFGVLRSTLAFTTISDLPFHLSVHHLAALQTCPLLSELTLLSLCCVQVPTSTRAPWRACSSTRTLSLPARTMARLSCGTWKRASLSVTWWLWRAAAVAVWCGAFEPPTPSWCAQWAAAMAPRRPSYWCWTLTWTWSERGTGGTTVISGEEGTERDMGDEAPANQRAKAQNSSPQLTRAPFSNTDHHHHNQRAVLSSTISIFLIPIGQMSPTKPQTRLFVQPLLLIPATVTTLTSEGIGLEKGDTGGVTGSVPRILWEKEEEKDESMTDPQKRRLNSLEVNLHPFRLGGSFTQRLVHSSLTDFEMYREILFLKTNPTPAHACPQNTRIHSEMANQKKHTHWGIGNHMRNVETFKGEFPRTVKTLRAARCIGENVVVGGRRLASRRGGFCR